MVFLIKIYVCSRKIVPEQTYYILSTTHWVPQHPVLKFQNFIGKIYSAQLFVALHGYITLRSSRGLWISKSCYTRKQSCRYYLHYFQAHIPKHVLFNVLICSFVEHKESYFNFKTLLSLLLLSFLLPGAK